MRVDLRFFLLHFAPVCVELRPRRKYATENETMEAFFISYPARVGVEK